MDILLQLLQVALFMAAAPLITGVIRKGKALVQHRRGASILQPYYDLIKLMHKEKTVPVHTGWIYRTAPLIYLGSALVAAALAPGVRGNHQFLFDDVLVFIYALAIGRFFLGLATIDATSTFTGMGSSRDFFIGMMAEPVLVFVLMASCLLSGKGTSFQAAMNGTEGIAVLPSALLFLSAWVMITLAETARIPVDDPSTHLELTMVHEAMTLEYSGRHMAAVSMAAWVKQMTFLSVAASLFMPFGSSAANGMPAAVLVMAGKFVVLTLLVFIIEINTVKLRIFSIPNLITFAFLLTLLGYLAGMIRI